MTTDKIDNHYFQQLSALMDGDLPPDQARFLLRRMEHDTELTGCWERWQLCGDALRGQARAPAPAGFAERVATAIAAEPMQPAASAASARTRGNLGKWGGGALAASLAAVALFMVRQQVPEEKPVPTAPAIASQAPASQTPANSPNPALEAVATVTAASVAVASVPRRQDNVSRRSATRTQQVARNAAAVRRNASDRTVASASAPVVPAATNVVAGNLQHDPFSNVQINAPASRPWPRAALPQYSGSGAFNAGYASDRAGQTFYPFEPRVPITTSEPAPQD